MRGPDSNEGPPATGGALDALPECPPAEPTIVASSGDDAPASVGPRHRGWGRTDGREKWRREFFATVPKGRLPSAQGLVEAEVVKRRSLRHGRERWRSYLCRQRAGPACKWKEVVKSETEVAKAVALEKSRARFAPSPKRAEKNSVSRVYASFESVGKLIFSDEHSLLVVSTALWETTRQGGVDASVARGVLDEALCGRQVLVRDGCRMSEKGAPVPEIFRGTCSGVEGGFCRDGQPLAVVVEFELYGEVNRVEL